MCVTCLVGLGVLASLGAAAGGPLAAPEPPAVNKDGAFFYAVSDLPFNPDPELQLIHGRIGDPRDWPASFYSLAGGGRCTSALVGARVLLTAAHCVGNGEQARISKAGVTYRGTCTHASGFSTNKTADWALCLMEQDVPEVPHERLNSDSSLLAIGGELLLTGFGCTGSDGSGGNDGIYRIGESRISKLPSGVNYDIVTGGGAALCFGDSGGPAFRVATTDKSSRTLVSVNSRGNIKDTSYLSSVTVEAFQTFAMDWSRTNKAEICGLSAKAVRCRE